jgi:hypothetical protein
MPDRRIMSCLLTNLFCDFPNGNVDLFHEGFPSRAQPPDIDMKMVLVAAIGDNLVIGREGQLPWRLRSDLQHFRKLTLNRPLIMGRKTHESIGKVLRWAD